MKMKLVIILSFASGVMTSVLAPMLVMATGMINMGADVNPGLIERTVGPWVRDRSVARHASQAKNPRAGDPAAIATGLVYYRENCVMCHGAPKVPAADFSSGLNPQPPSLEIAAKDTPDGELFWSIKHGIRMTPMPAFGFTRSDDEIWAIVAFVRHLSELTALERDSLRTTDSEITLQRDGNANAIPQ